MTKQEILEATLDLACEQGLGRISMSQIADRVGLKKSSLYSHFKSKDEIIGSMYTHFRDRAKQQTGNASMDLGSLMEGRTFREILLFAVNSYREMNTDSEMYKFYQLILSERTHDPAASAVMVEETTKMLMATKAIFYAASAKGVARFEDPDGAALVFAMGVHSLMDFEFDARNAGLSAADGMMEKYIDEFCRRYDA